MNLHRRIFLQLAAGAAALPFTAGLARAQSWPTRPVTIVVGFPAGSPPDITARLAAQWLNERLGQPFIVDNKPGAASNIGAEAAARAAPDGYTLLMTVATNAVNANLYDNLRFDFLRDLTPVSSMAGTAYVLVATPSLPVKSLQEFIAYAKANPGKINMASAGNGSAPHVTGELLKMMAGIDLLHVPYRGQFVPDLMSGQVHVAFTTPSQVIGNIQQGQLRPLGVTSAARASILPDVPAIAELVRGYDVVGWYGFTTPTGTPADIIDKLSKTISAMMAEPAAKEKLAGLGLDPLIMSTAEFTRFVREETDKWAKVIKFANIKAS